jgi:hypothetical protein
MRVGLLVRESVFLIVPQISALLRGSFLRALAVWYTVSKTAF